MFPFLHVGEHDSWHHLVTGDESRSFLNPSPRRMQTLSRDHMVTKPRLDIQSKNSYLRSCGIRAAPMLSIDCQMIAKMSSAYFITNILIPLEQVIFPRGRAPHQKRLVIHVDNCSICTNLASTDWLKEHDMRRMSHPPTLFA
jgi:hypothetical protein